MTFRAAFYKGTRPGFPGVVNRVGRFFSHGPYSHSELIFSDGLSGSSEPKLGVRLKAIGYTTAANWDFLELPHVVFSEANARRWFDAHLGTPYDYAGCIRFGLGFVPESPTRAFCSESNAAALGAVSPDRLCPNGLYAWVRDMTRGITSGR